MNVFWVPFSIVTFGALVFVLILLVYGYGDKVNTALKLIALLIFGLLIYSLTVLLHLNYVDFRNPCVFTQRNIPSWRKSSQQYYFTVDNGRREYEQKLSQQSNCIAVDRFVAVLNEPGHVYAIRRIEPNTKTYDSVCIDFIVPLDEVDQATISHNQRRVWTAFIGNLLMRFPARFDVSLPQSNAGCPAYIEKLSTYETDRVTDPTNETGKTEH